MDLAFILGLIGLLDVIIAAIIIGGPIELIVHPEGLVFVLGVTLLGTYGSFSPDRVRACLNAETLVSMSKAGRRVVRLKGGDPSIFGRSAEEMAHLGREGIPVHICPGITTASAAAASGHMSLTLRGVARGLTLVTAHLMAGEPLALDWPALASSGTLGIYMGRAAASEISRNLIDAGRHPDTPVMVAVNVSLPTERLIRGKLSALAFLVQAVSDKEPTLLLIGEAVVDHGRAEAQGNRALLPA